MTRTALYRHYDAQGRLLYVGISDCLAARDKQHRATAHWHKDVHRTETQWCLSREHAADLERVAVRHEKPLHNAALTITIGPKAKSALPDLVCEIEAAAAVLGVSPATVGERAGQGGKFYARLCDGKRAWPQTVEKVRAWISENVPAAQVVSS